MMAFSHVREIRLFPKSEEEVSDPTYVPRSRRWKAKHVMGRASKYLKQHRFEEAAVFYEKAIQREPDLPEVYNNKGYCMLMTALRPEEIQKTIKLFTKALEINPKYAHALYNRGVARHKLATAMLLESGEKSTVETDKLVQLALRDFDGCISADRFFAKAYHNRGVCLSLLRDTKRATGNMTRAILITDEESILHKYHRTGAYMPLEERSNIIDKEEKKGDLNDESSVLISECESSLASGSKMSIDADSTRMKTNKSENAKLSTYHIDLDSNSMQKSADDIEKQGKQMHQWQKEKAYQMRRKKLHFRVTRDGEQCKLDCYKSLKARQFLHERRVETDASESDRAKLDLLKMEIGIESGSDGEEQSEIKDPGQTSPSLYNQDQREYSSSATEQAHRIDAKKRSQNDNLSRPMPSSRSSKTVGKKGSMLQSRRK